MINLQVFNQIEFINAIKSFFKELNVPINSVSDEPTTAKDILRDFYKNNSTFQLIDDVYFVGIVDDAAFAGNQSLNPSSIKSDYDGILIFGMTLKERPNGSLPTRSQVAEIARAFNRAFYYTPVVVILKYGNHLAFANTDRLKYKQEWREGEKAGKVSLLRDINIDNPHSGHERILRELEIPTSGNKKVDSFSKLYTYWQEVFSVSLLNKKFYQELSNWYFWATKHVVFPGEPSIEDAHRKNAKLENLLQEHRATNVIRMLTRLLFVWFVKEKKLIPEELFELKDLQKDILKDIAPYHDNGLFKERNTESVYYKAILQNLFFATLNCPIEGDNFDKRKRGFRGEGYGTHRGIDYLMRYKQYFKNPDAFLEKLNAVVPFLNGGLFECLDDKFNNTYIDGFSDQMVKGEQLIVPDYLFFGLEEEEDLSDIVGIKDKKYKKAAVKGLINILKSYKFTITENTPIEEDVALDPELLGKVFENLLASYNPETQTTARKQTGSFYTPREIVNYMVDTSLIAYLKDAVKSWKGIDDDALAKGLYELTSFDNNVPFTNDPDLQKEIISVLGTCTILDPACGSGAFPMGVLQKMVHILQKLDPGNTTWKEIQMEKARKDSEAVFDIEDKQAREDRLIEINDAFDQSINDPDYARKLFLIENCIYGVDIQPIATQISKLRFFISLVVDQKVNPDKENFGIRPLPNLETKFVAANTLVGIEKESNLFSTDEIKELEKQLKKVRSKLFSARTKETKIKYRTKDKEIRSEIAEKLKAQGLPLESAEKLASWDPYGQNSSSPFFDSEWMFDINDGFDVIIGNPPYVFGGSEKISEKDKKYFKSNFASGTQKINLFSIFIEKGIQLIKDGACLSYIIPNTLLRVTSYSNIREYIYKNSMISEINDLDVGVFEGVTASTIIVRLIKDETTKNDRITEKDNLITIKSGINSDVYQLVRQSEYKGKGYILDIFTKMSDRVILNHLTTNSIPLGEISKIIRFGVVITKNLHEVVGPIKSSAVFKKFLEGDEISSFRIDYGGRYLHYKPSLLHRSRTPDVFEEDKIMIQRITGGSKPVKAVFDNTGYYNKESILNLQLLSGEYSYHYILALLNSSVVNWYYKQKFTNNSKLTVNLSKEYITQIPIIKADALDQSTVSFISKLLSFLNGEGPVFNNLYKVLDGLIFNLYFPSHMQDLEINVLEFIERDISEVMPNKDFEVLGDTEKEKVIEQLQAKWSHPDNVVYNRIKLFAVRSSEILKPILES